MQEATYLLSTARRKQCKLSRGHCVKGYHKFCPSSANRTGLGTNGGIQDSDSKVSMPTKGGSRKSLGVAVSSDEGDCVGGLEKMARKTKTKSPTAPGCQTEHGNFWFHGTFCSPLQQQCLPSDHDTASLRSLRTVHGPHFTLRSLAELG